MIILEINRDKLVVPEPKDLPFLEEIKKQMLKDKKRALKYLERAYLKFRNIEVLPLKKKEKLSIYEIFKSNNTLEDKIKLVCATGTIRGALLNDIVITGSVPYSEYEKIKK